MKKHYTDLQKKLIKQYSKRVQFIEKHLDSPRLQKLWNKHKDILHDNYSPQLWYLTEQFLFRQAMVDRAEILEEKKSDFYFSEVEEDLFEKWNKSEFSQDFLDFVQKGQSVKKATLSTLKIVEKHLEVLFQRIILDKDIDHASYHENESLGEKRTKEGLVHIPSIGLHFEGKDLRFHYHSAKEKADFPQKILVALTLIEEFSPSSFERFSFFTDTIIPIKQKEFVSFSHQELPGTSMINLYHRDFVDLMDDLLHENGHHHLNYHLNLEKLIDEPTDNIYYSPWRETLRPLRGIYHAYFTFFWAFKLFSDLSKSDLKHPYYEFSTSEKEKIHRRAVEEMMILDYVFTDLVRAEKNGLITKKGMKLVEDLQAEILAEKKNILKLKKKLSKDGLKKIEELEKDLVKAKIDFR